MGGRGSAGLCGGGMRQRVRHGTLRVSAMCHRETGSHEHKKG
jgi:hypothetical protein